jgi:hypothetical protein
MEGFVAHGDSHMEPNEQPSLEGSAAQPKQLAIPVSITNSTVALPMVLRTLAIS